MVTKFASSGLATSTTLSVLRPIGAELVRDGRTKDQSYDVQGEQNLNRCPSEIDFAVRLIQDEQRISYQSLQFVIGHIRRVCGRERRRWRDHHVCVCVCF